MSLITLQKLLTQDQYPNLFSNNSQYIDTYSYPYLQNYSDPYYVNYSEPQKHEYRYVNSNGVDVIIRGTYNDVMSTVDVLNTYPPKKECNKEKEREYFAIGKKPSFALQSKNVPDVGIQSQPNGKHLLISFNNKVYSGSGALIIVKSNKSNKSTFDLSEANFLLFRDSKTNQYEELGGKIDNPLNTNNTKSPIDKTILFNNAAKEANEESMTLITLTNESKYFVDIESQDNNTYYRAYLYVITVDDPKNINIMFEQNKLGIYKYSDYFDESYREMNSVDLFDCKTFIKKLQDYHASTQNVSNGVFQTINGTNVNVRNRTIKVIAKMIDEKIIDNIHSLPPQNVQIEKPASTDGFYHIKI